MVAALATERRDRFPVDADALAATSGGLGYRRGLRITAAAHTDLFAALQLLRTQMPTAQRLRRRP